ncbi:MAG: hypothetical protein BZY67_03520 [SAR202 cluster bacterium Io17-Chloro-G1]|nr:MAG: hypothetical protein BZY67_03520 [SAR202 cluster bacterium Io17-Chloro-G1]
MSWRSVLADRRASPRHPFMGVHASGGDEGHGRGSGWQRACELAIGRLPGHAWRIQNHHYNQPANVLGVLVTDTGVEVKADADFPVKTDNMPLSYAGQLLAAMLQGAGTAASASKPTKRLPMTPRPVPPPPLIAPEMTSLATVSGETFRVRLAADVYVGSTGYKSKVVIFDDEVQLYAHPQGGR